MWLSQKNHDIIFKTISQGVCWGRRLARKQRNHLNIDTSLSKNITNLVVLKNLRALPDNPDHIRGGVFKKCSCSLFKDRRFLLVQYKSNIIYLYLSALGRASFPKPQQSGFPFCGPPERIVQHIGLL